MIKVKHFAKGSIIIEENDIGEEIYLLQEGRVEVYSGQGVDRIVFGELKSGEIFGEMSVIDEKPRSASIRVLEDCTVKVLHRDQFLDVLALDKDIASLILSNLFSRLRRANSTRKSSPVNSKENSYQSMVLVGMTSEAQRVFPQHPFPIPKFPFVIGRKTRDPLARQDLAIYDSKPYQLSRHHAMFDRDEKGFFIQDMGSQLGVVVDGKAIGGRNIIDHQALQGGEEITLGGKSSPYRFRVELS